MIDTTRVPVRIRLALWYAGTFLLVLGLFGAGTFYAMSASMEAGFDRELRLRLAGIEEYLERNDPVSVAGIQHELSEDSELRPGGELLQVSDGEGHWIYQSDSVRRLRIGVRPAKERRPELATVRVRDFPVRLLSATDVVRGRRYDIQIGQSLEESSKFLTRFRWLLAIASPLLMLAASAAGYWMARRALQPVIEITADARAIRAFDLGNRIKLPAAKDELRELSQTLNEMLGRLEAAFRRITQFTADASHELRTPVAIIRTTAELALAENSPRASREALFSILQESERTTEVLESLLALARADSDARLKMARVDAVAAAREAFSQASVIAESRGIAMRFESDLESGEVTGNSDSLRRLFLIVMDNGIKYTAAGGTVCMQALEEAGEIVFKIRDTGSGIAAEDLPHIFERFYRADKARDRSGGAGLGLAIAEWLAKSHQAAIEVSSLVDKGTEVTIRLAAAAVVRRREVTSAPLPQPMSGPGRQG